MRTRDGRLGELLSIAARRRGQAGFCFEDLIAPARYHGATVGELAEWLARARSAGLVEAMVTDPAERRLGRRFRIVTADHPVRGMSRARRAPTAPATPEQRSTR